MSKVIYIKSTRPIPNILMGNYFLLETFFFHSKEGNWSYLNRKREEWKWMFIFIYAEWMENISISILLVVNVKTFCQRSEIFCLLKHSLHSFIYLSFSIEFLLVFPNWWKWWWEEKLCHVKNCFLMFQSRINANFHFAGR